MSSSNPPPPDSTPNPITTTPEAEQRLLRAKASIGTATPFGSVPPSPTLRPSGPSSSQLRLHMPAVVSASPLGPGEQASAPTTTTSPPAMASPSPLALPSAISPQPGAGIADMWGLGVVSSPTAAPKASSTTTTTTPARPSVDAKDGADAAADRKTSHDLPSPLASHPVGTPTQGQAQGQGQGQYFPSAAAPAVSPVSAGLQGTKTPAVAPPPPPPPPPTATTAAAAGAAGVAGGAGGSGGGGTTPPAGGGGGGGVAAAAAAAAPAAGAVAAVQQANGMGGKKEKKVDEYKAAFSHFLVSQH